MSHLKNNLVFSSLTILLVTGGSLGLAQSTHNKVSSQKLEAKNVNQVSNYSGDIDLLAVSQPTTPTTNNGQINSAFINRFNNAVILDSKTGQFVIDKNFLPTNTTQMELASLNKLISDANAGLKGVVAQAPKGDVVQVGNSVVVADNPTTAKEIAQGTQAKTVSTHHNGSNYIHHYWWGYRIGISGTTLHKASLGLNAAALFPYDKWIPVGWVISVVCGILGIASGASPGGVVFNYSGLPGTPYGTIWSVGWQ